MPNPVNPIKAIQGGIKGVQVKSMAIKMNNQSVKSGDMAKAKSGPAPKMQTMTPAKAVKAFVSGASNPARANQAAKELKAFGGAKKPGAK